MENSNYEYEHPLTEKDKEVLQQDFNKLQPKLNKWLRLLGFRYGYIIHIDITNKSVHLYSKTLFWFKFRLKTINYGKQQ